jgi:hypothetical protein
MSIGCLLLVGASSVATNLLAVPIVEVVATAKPWGVPLRLAVEVVATAESWSGVPLRLAVLVVEVVATAQSWSGVIILCMNQPSQNQAKAECC